MKHKKNTSQQRETALLERKGSLVLVGLMGVGKTTVGRRLARQLNYKFIDSDEEIEKAANLKVADIFDIYGEGEFRALERRVIERILGGKPVVLATGGGAFMDSDTRALIKDCATSVWLDADIDVLVERTGRRDTRPLLKKGDPREILRRQAEIRNPVYAEADVRVQSQGGAHNMVVEAILKALNGRGGAQQ